MQERILTPEQVSQILQVHPFTVLKFIKQGRLKASKLGRVYRIRESDVELFLDESSGSPKSMVKVVTERKTKTKNKISQIESTPDLKPIEEERPTVSQEEKLLPPTDHSTHKVSVDVVEDTSNQPKSGGQDYYYIL
jgi:excisionase family DNA binding protein